MQLKPEHN